MAALSAFQPLLYFGMALEAALVLLRDEHSPEIGGVGAMARQALAPIERVVAYAACHFLHQVLVAFGAHGHALFLQKLAFLRTVRRVARAAVPRENRLLCGFFFGTPRPLPGAVPA